MSTNFEDLIGRSNTAGKPAAGKPGRLWFDTSLDKLQRDNGSAWEDVERTDGTPTFSGARYNSNSAQNIVNNASVAIINFEDQVYDTDSAVTVGASWKYTAPATGYYHIDVMALFAQATTLGGAERILLQLFKNNSLLLTLDRQDGFTNTVTLQAIGKGSVTINLSAGDYIDIRIAQNSGGDLALSNDAGQVWINIEKVG